MRVASAAWVWLLVALVCLAGAVYTNDTRAVAYGFRV